MHHKMLTVNYLGAFWLNLKLGFGMFEYVLVCVSSVNLLITLILNVMLNYSDSKLFAQA